jgi:hypothetical protein
MDRISQIRFQDIYAFIAKDSRMYAKRQIFKIGNRIDILVQFIKQKKSIAKRGQC